MSGDATAPATPAPSLFPPRAPGILGAVAAAAAGLAISTLAGERAVLASLGDTDFHSAGVRVSVLAGLAIGAAFLGRSAGERAHPERALACLAALAAGVWLLAPFLTSAATAAGSGFPRPAAFLSICALVFALPAGLVGGMLPVSALPLDRSGPGEGLLSGVVTASAALGGAAGALASWRWIVPDLGLRGALFTSAALALFAAGLALVLDLGGRSRGSDPERREPEDGPASWPAWAGLGTGIGLVLLGAAEARGLTLMVGASSPALADMLAAFVAGIGIGALVLGPIACTTPRPIRLLVGVHGVAGLVAVVGVLAAEALPSTYLGILRDVGGDADGVDRSRLLLSCLVLIPAGAALGGALPIVARLRGRGVRGMARSVSALAGGAAIGLAACGPILSAGPGIGGATRLAAGICLALAFGGLLVEPGSLAIRWALPAGLGIVVLTGALLLAPRWDPLRLSAGIPFEPLRFYDEAGRIRLDRLLAREELAGWWEGARATTAVVQTSKGRALRVDGLEAGSDAFEDVFSRHLLAHLAVGLHPGRVRAACVLGPGSGPVLEALALHDVESLTVVGEEPGLAKAWRLLRSEDRSVLDDPRLELRIGDARSFLAGEERRFDVLSASLDLPWRPRAALVMSREFWALARARLAPDGLALWGVPLRGVLPEHTRALVATFSDVFPHARLFTTGSHVILAARGEPFPELDVVRLEERFGGPGIADALEQWGFPSALALFAYYQGDDAETRALANGARPITDDRPSLERTAGHGLLASALGPSLGAVVSARASIEERARRLGLEGDARSSFLELAEAADATLDGAVLLAQGRGAEGLERLTPHADSGQRLAAHWVADAMERAGLALERRGESEGARRLLALAFRLEPERFDALLGLASAEIRLGGLDAADRILTFALGRRPFDGEALWRMGLLRQAQGRLQEAEAMARQAARLDPHLPQPHGVLGRTLLASGALEAALEEFERAHALGDRSLEVFLGRARALVALGREGEALAWAREAVDFFPVSVEALEDLASLAEAQGRPEEAAQVRRRAKEIRAREEEP